MNSCTLSQVRQEKWSETQEGGYAADIYDRVLAHRFLPTSMVRNMEYFSLLGKENLPRTLEEFVVEVMELLSVIHI